MSNNDRTIERIKKKSDLPCDKKVILYAPIWHDNRYYELSKYKFDVQLNLQRMKAEPGADYIIVLRLHYLVAEILNLMNY